MAVDQYGFGGGDYGTPSLQKMAVNDALSSQKQRNRQLQKPYAAENGMAQAQAPQTEPDGTSTDKTTQSTQTQQYGGFTPSASPVTPDGQIRATTQEQYQAPVQTQSSVSTTPKAPPPPPANAQPVAAAIPQAPVAGQSPYGNYPARPANTNWTPDLSGIPAAAAPAYQPTTFNSYMNALPNLSGLDEATQSAVMGALENPTGLDTEAMKARLREDALAMADRMKGQVDQDVASRGTFGGGWQGGTKSDLDAAALSDILGGYRDIDIEAADRANADRIAAIAAAQGWGESQFGRGLETGQFAREGEQAQAAENLRAQQSQADAITQALQLALAPNALTSQAAGMSQANYGADLDAYFQRMGLDTNAALTREGYGTDLQKAKMAQLVNLLQLAQNAWSDQNHLDLGWGQLGQGALSNALNFYR